MHWENALQIRQNLEQLYQQILQQRMLNLPMVNPALKVQALDFKIYADYWVGILLTPWFMNLMLLPEQAAVWENLETGEKISCQFPSGLYQFIVGKEPSLGHYASCSLYSPMFQFDQQSVAESAAQAAWKALFMEAEVINASLQPKAQTISRRDLLRGMLTAKETHS